MRYLGIFGLEIEKTIAIFEINTIKFVGKLCRKTKNKNG